jgi:hypothetical protein
MDVSDEVLCELFHDNVVGIFLGVNVVVRE